MLRGTFLWLSEHQGIFSFVRRNGFAPRFALRFVAGKTLGAALRATRELYPYLRRRLAERPANVTFIIGNVLKETLSRT